MKKLVYLFAATIIGSCNNTADKTEREQADSTIINEPKIDNTRIPADSGLTRDTFNMHSARLNDTGNMRSRGY
ncbi:MAG TPA: hypothetical protein VGO58_05675 [Chitinophagaceae bacterium]|jgi:hypothetical protein|nr:hypothetical protein [Chitinophagaceae bacterium]